MAAAHGPSVAVSGPFPSPARPPATAAVWSGHGYQDRSAGSDRDGPRQSARARLWTRRRIVRSGSGPGWRRVNRRHPSPDTATCRALHGRDDGPHLEDRAGRAARGRGRQPALQPVHSRFGRVGVRRRRRGIHGTGVVRAGLGRRPLTRSSGDGQRGLPDRRPRPRVDSGLERLPGEHDGGRSGCQRRRVRRHLVFDGRGARRPLGGRTEPRRHRQGRPGRPDFAARGHLAEPGSHRADRHHLPRGGGRVLRRQPRPPARRAGLRQDPPDRTRRTRERVVRGAHDDPWPGIRRERSAVRAGELHLRRAVPATPRHRPPGARGWRWIDRTDRDRSDAPDGDDDGPGGRRVVRVRRRISTSPEPARSSESPSRSPANAPTHLVGRAIRLVRSVRLAQTRHDQHVMVPAGPPISYSAPR